MQYNRTRSFLRDNDLYRSFNLPLAATWGNSGELQDMIQEDAMVRLREQEEESERAQRLVNRLAIQEGLDRERDLREQRAAKDIGAEDQQRNGVKREDQQNEANAVLEMSETMTRANFGTTRQGHTLGPVEIKLPSFQRKSDPTHTYL